MGREGGGVFIVTNREPRVNARGFLKSFDSAFVFLFVSWTRLFQNYLMREIYRANVTPRTVRRLNIPIFGQDIAGIVDDKYKPISFFLLTFIQCQPILSLQRAVDAFGIGGIFAGDEIVDRGRSARHCRDAHRQPINFISTIIHRADNARIAAGRARFCAHAKIWTRRRRGWRGRRDRLRE